MANTFRSLFAEIMKYIPYNSQIATCFANVKEFFDCIWIGFTLLVQVKV